MSIYSTSAHSASIRCLASLHTQYTYTQPHRRRGSHVFTTGLVIVIHIPKRRLTGASVASSDAYLFLQLDPFKSHFMYMGMGSRQTSDTLLLVYIEPGVLWGGIRERSPS